MRFLTYTGASGPEKTLAHAILDLQQEDVSDIVEKIALLKVKIIDKGGYRELECVMKYFSGEERGDVRFASGLGSDGV